MLAIHEEPRDLNIILLDEPDSHIHRDIQRRLVKNLVEHTDRTQVFLTTHNESLIRSTRPEHLFHLEPRQNKTYHPICRDLPSGAKRGLQPSRQLKILRTLGSETSIDFLNALEAERLVLVEGEDDARFIEAIVERGTSPPAPFYAMYWSFDGVDTIFERIDAYREVFRHIKNDRSLWDKAVLVIDRDYLTDQQRTALHLEQRVADPNVLSELFHRLRARRERLARLGVKANHVFPGDGELQPAFTQYASAALASGQVHLLATKDDVAALVEGVYQGLSIPFQPENLFERMVDAATPSTWFEEWKALRQFVKA